MANILTLEHYPNLPAISIQLSALRLVLLPNCAYAAWALLPGQSQITLKRSMKNSLGAGAAFIMMLSKITLAKYLSSPDTQKSEKNAGKPKGKVENRDFFSYRLVRPNRP